MVNYKGQAIFEGAIRRVFTDPKFQWSTEVQDMVKKGSGEALIGGKVETLKGWLSQQAPQASMLRESVGLLREVMSSVRSRKCTRVKQDFFDRFKKVSMALRAGQHQLNHLLVSEGIDALLDGLALVQDQPGATDERKELQAWRTAQVKVVAQNDLLQLMQSQAERIDFELLRACLTHCEEGDGEMPEEFSADVVGPFLQNALRDVMDKAHWLLDQLFLVWKGNTVQSTM